MIRSLYDAFNRRDMDKNLQLVTDDVKWTNIPFNLTFSGHKGYREFLDNWTTAMSDCKVEIVNTVVGEEWTAVELIGRGTHTGPLVGPQGTISATQKKLELQFCDLLRIKDGRITEGRVYFDAATLLRQFGALPQTLAMGQPVPSGR